MTLTRIDAAAPFDIWLVDLSCEPGSADIACLSDKERQRAKRYRYHRHSRRYLAAHCSLRRLLADYTGLAPERLGFEAGEFGKPFLADRPDWRFSVSYADDTALMALSCDMEIGVDLESLRTIDDAGELAELHFTEGERAELLIASILRMRDPAFLRGWTRKEACLKAAGTGLSLPAKSFETGLGEASRTLSLPAAAGVFEAEVASIDVAEGLIAAWARIMPADRSDAAQSARGLRVRLNQPQPQPPEWGN